MPKKANESNNLLVVNPELAAQWHPTLNDKLTPSDVMAGANRKVWWSCTAHPHAWEAEIKNRSRGSGCRICAGQEVLEGFNDLGTLNPELAAQWHPTLNDKLTPSDVMAGANRKVWWSCTAHPHAWEAEIKSRSRGDGCRICAGQEVLEGFNDLGTLNPELAAQWHPTWNGELTPADVTAGSNMKVWWSCTAHPHAWDATVKNRSQGTGCRICAGKEVLEGFNDLGTLNPELASQWHPTWNGELTPAKVTVGFSKHKVWWSCTDHTHEWDAKISSRSGGHGCPFCGGKKVLEGFNDLGTLNPELAAQWHPTKNGDLTPAKVTTGTDQKVWWSCTDHGHAWDARIDHRSQGHGCSVCSTGKTEKAFRENFAKFSGFDFQTCKIPLIRLSRKMGIAQVDMINEELKLVIEYDGEWTHGGNGPAKKSLVANLAQDQETTEALAKEGYNVIRIREHSPAGKLPFVPLDPGYEDKVFQIAYTSQGKKKNKIEDIVKQVIEQKAEWFIKA